MPTKIVTPHGTYSAKVYESEHAFEAAVVANAVEIFGAGRFYLDCKRAIGTQGKKINIPDGYLIDLRGKVPQLYVVENELASHDLFRHIGIQLLEFSYTYSLSPRKVKQVVAEEIYKNQAVRHACDEYAISNGYRNLDHLLDFLVEQGFAAIVLIDEATEELNKVVNKFAFPVNVIELSVYADTSEQAAYVFSPFLDDVEVSLPGNGPGVSQLDASELDTVIIGFTENGFQAFLDENRSYAIRMSSSMIQHIKHIAVYQIAPRKAITHVATVDKIISWGDTGKYCVEIAEPAREIGPVPLDGKGPKTFRLPRYTTLSRLSAAKSISDVFGG